MKRFTILSFACLALLAGCADVETAGTESAFTAGACRSTEAMQVQKVSEDVASAVAKEAAEEQDVRDPSKAVVTPPIDPASGEVKAMQGDAQHSVTLAIPATRCGSSATDPDKGLTLFSSDQPTFSTALAGDTDGAFRALIHIASADAPTEYAFPIQLPPGGQLVELEDGGAVVSNADGDILATLTPPWATDANGVKVPTRYEIRGTTLIQHVELSAALAYPVVADPFWIPVLFVAGHFGRHALQQMALRGVSQELAKQVVLNGIKTKGKQAGTSVFTRGKGAKRIRVIVNNKTGKVITVTKG